MRWDSDDAFKLYLPCGILFVLGFLAKLFGIVGFLIGAGLAFLVARYIAVWIRDRFEIKSATPEDRLDLAMRQNTIIEAVEVLTKGKARP